ncbi:acyloxyacyl hydrolase [Trichlorobacter lovleyi]|uniref:acyloxyacyl hydrolase n=1 Tax=Trichlorobacter lovleyi TaxID=313985 RepID=UPI00223FD423|nr:acyloxyacyl hydrolase [Trichlorobacter lovleyi]QOX79238.1 acyloxyacyl hydrolase [Trichlorobacter lovleyi]
MVKTLLTALLVALATSPAGAGDLGKTTADAGYELTLLTGYGITHRGFGETRTQVQTWDAIARLGWYLSDEVAQGSWYQGRHQLLVELPYHLAVDQGGRSMLGGYLLGSWKFTSLSHVKPYIFAGGGPLFVDLGLPTMGAKLNFSYQGGTGVQIPIAQATMLNLEYRYHHISNAGTASPNQPLNSSKILLGVSWLY